MQPDEKIAPKSTGRRVKQPVKKHHLSSFGILNRNGLEINSGGNLPAIEEGYESKLSEFSNWSMPEQPKGYIQGRIHDFF